MSKFEKFVLRAACLGYAAFTFFVCMFMAAFSMDAPSSTGNTALWIFGFWFVGCLIGPFLVLDNYIKKETDKSKVVGPLIISALPYFALLVASMIF